MLVFLKEDTAVVSTELAGLILKESEYDYICFKILINTVSNN